MEGVNAKLGVLQQLLGGRDAALQVSRGRTRLLLSNAWRLQRNAEHLQQLLGLEQQAPELAAVLRQQPTLLTFSPDTLHTKLQQRCEGLGMNLGDVQRMCTVHLTPDC